MAESKTKTVRYYVPALEKGLDILEVLSRMAVPQPQADIARALGRKTSEIFRMLDCLEQRAYVLRDEAGRYSLSLKLFELAHTHSPVEKLLEAARTPMRDLAQSLRESVHLGILHGGQLLVLVEELSPDPIRISVEVGGRFSAVETTSGRLLLAQLDEEALAAFLDNDPDFVSSGKQAQKAFKRQLSDVRKHPYLVAESDVTVGVQDAVVLVGQPDLGVSAALSVPLLMVKHKQRSTDSILEPLQLAAADINQRLGLST